MSEPTYAISADGSAILCRRCHTTSYNPNDIRERYCARCKLFHEDAQAAASPEIARTPAAAAIASNDEGADG